MADEVEELTKQHKDLEVHLLEVKTLIKSQKELP